MFDVRRFFEHREMRGELLPYLVFDCICILRPVDQNDSVWLSLRELAISFANALIKFGGLLLHPISFATLMPHPRLRRRSIHIEHDCYVRNAIANGKLIETLDHLAIQHPCRSLINGCGIEEPIGNHAPAPFERGLDYLAHELAATSLKKEQLSLGRHAGVVRRKLQKLAETFSDRSAARLARQGARNTAKLKDRSEPFGLCGFSASFRPLECDERQPRHDVTCAQSSPFSSSKSVSAK